MIIRNERTHFIMGLVLSIFTIYVGLAIISFFFTGAADQSQIENISLKTLIANKVNIRNWTGIRGAYMANVLVNRWFGVSSLLLLFFTGSAGAKLMKCKGISLIKRFLFSISTLIWGSLFFGFFFSWPDTFIYWGGEHGIKLAEWLTVNIGAPGTILVIVGLFLSIAVVSNSRTMPLLYTIFTFNWLKLPSISFRRKEKEEEYDEEEEEEERPSAAPTTPIAVSPPIVPAPSRPSDSQFQITVAPEEEEYNQSTTPSALRDGRQELSDRTLEEGDDEFPADMEDYDPRLDLSAFRSPTLDLLQKYESGERQVDFDEQIANQRRIKQTLENFGISIASIKATVGPTITLYEVVPDAGVRISKIKNLEDDIALNLEALGIRIIAPMPGKGTIGIEVPNKDPQIVSMQSVIASKKFMDCKYDLPIALGKTITNEIFMFDLCKMPHLLVAGATGQGKSVGLNAIITSMLYKKHPSELKFVLVDPKMVEFNIYDKIERHYLAKLPESDKAIITDPTKVIQTLNSLCKEMDDRYDLLMQAHVRDVKSYNDKFIHRRLSPLKGHRYMPYIVVIIDEFGDLIMTSGKEIELPIARIAQKARAVGLHMVIATQRPSTNIITGTIKANFPARMAFRVSSMIDSRTILDQPGANRLIGRGDMLFSQGSDVIRVQCAFVDTPEVEQISEYIGKQTGYSTAFVLPEYLPEGGSIGSSDSSSIDLGSRDPLFDEVARAIVLEQQGSVSFIQRKFSIGYNRAGRLMDQIEAVGIVGSADGSKPRQLLIQDEVSLEHILKSLK
ncbi:MAG: DNA translocase FtsK [Tannerellaceae bacterium]|nr:DNA translocase FtsK [Tannerellaceae bacterium]